MLTLSYGFKKPENGDLSESWFVELANNVQLLNDHTHNGTNSAKISTLGVNALTQALPNTGWAPFGSIYSQSVTLPSAQLYDNYYVSFKTTAGEPVFLSAVKTSSTAYTIYSNDNTLGLVAYYTT